MAFHPFAPSTAAPHTCSSSSTPNISPDSSAQFPIVQQGFFIGSFNSTNTALTASIPDRPTVNHPLHVSALQNSDPFGSNSSNHLSQHHFCAATPSSFPFIHPVCSPADAHKGSLDNNSFIHHDHSNPFHLPMDWVTSNSSSTLLHNDLHHASFPVAVPIPVSVPEITPPLSFSLNTPVTPALLNATCHSNSLPFSMACSSPILATFYEEDDTDTNSNSKSIQAIYEKRRRRRESHNAVERRRRDNINERIAELGLLLPEYYVGNDPSIKPNKGQILRKVVDYVRHLQQTLKECLDHQIDLLDALRQSGINPPLFNSELPQTIHALLTLPQHSITALTTLADSLAAVHTNDSVPVSSISPLSPTMNVTDTGGQLSVSMKSMLVSSHTTPKPTPSPLTPMAKYPVASPSHVQPSSFSSSSSSTLPYASDLKSFHCLDHHQPTGSNPSKNLSTLELRPLITKQPSSLPLSSTSLPELPSTAPPFMSLVPLQGHAHIPVLPPQQFLS